MCLNFVEISDINSKHEDAVDLVAILLSSSEFLILSTAAEPTTIPSDILAIFKACSGVRIPNPITTGRSLYFLMLSIFRETSSGLAVCVPVTPVIET